MKKKETIIIKCEGRIEERDIQNFRATPALKKYDVIVTENNAQVEFPERKIHLRDYFAGQAMNAIIIGNGADSCAMGIGAAKDAYSVADAMIEQRGKNE